jgi:hypothetical protein
VPGKLTNSQLKDYAVTLIERAIGEIEHSTIVERAENYPDIAAITEFDALLVQELIDTAEVAISWPKAG